MSKRVAFRAKAHLAFATALLTLAAPTAQAWLPGINNPTAVAGFVVDAKSRNDVLSFYNCIYQASENYSSNIGWTGSVAAANPGTTTAVFKDDVRRRVNFYRALVGHPADITFNAIKSSKAQEAALMMSANNQLSHTPPPSWLCYTANGAEAAGSSNLALGMFGPGAINGYMEDPGGNNLAVGHRRWILYTLAKEMGTGDVPRSGSNSSSNTLWVIGDFKGSGPTKFVAWPNEGFVPQSLVPGRWSLSYPNANFASANVTMTQGGNPISLNIVSRTDNGYGDNTIVWEPSGISTSVTADVPYIVTVSGIGGGPTSKTYTVNVFNPDILTDSVTITGTSSPPASGQTYTFNSVEHADKYELQISKSTMMGGAASTILASDATSFEFNNTTTGGTITPGTTYYMRIRASLGGRWYEFGTIKTVTAGPAVAPNGIVLEQPAGTNISDEDTKVFPATVLGGSTTLTFRIRNNGAVNITGIALSSDGANAGDFNVDTTGTANFLAPGSYTTFAVTFGPMALGTRTAALHIVSSDTPRSPLDITLSGTGIVQVAPEISVEQPAGSELVDDASIVDFGTAMTGSAAQLKSFTIRNTGTGDLTGIAVSQDGPESLDFTVNTFGMLTTLSPGGATTFTVNFAPGAAGARNAVIHITSNDANENPFDIALSGTGTLPALPEITVEQPVGNVLSDNGGSVSFGTVNTGSLGTAKLFTIRNTGTADLTSLSISKDGMSSGEFLLNTTGMATSLAPGESATFTVTFLPISGGPRVAALHVASNDMARNPFDIPLAGIGNAVPDIAIEYPAGNSLVDGAGTVSFGDAAVRNGIVTKLFTIRNTGAETLGGIAVTKVGGQADDFTINTTSMAASLPPGAVTMFAVTFVPSASGPRATTLQITSNDPDEATFDVALSGSGVDLPKIVVEQPAGSPLTNAGASLYFGNAGVGMSAVYRIFTIRNDGTANLTDLSVVSNGTNSGDFAPNTAAMATTLSPGASTTFAVAFAPAAIGSSSAVLRIASNDPDQHLFEIPVSGFGVGVPRIVLEYPADNALTDGVSMVPFTDADVGVTRTFTIRNTGSAALTGLVLGKDGANPDDFRLNLSGTVSMLAPGASTTFGVTFYPGANGIRTATLHVLNNDPDHNPFDVALRAISGPMPDISIEIPKGVPIASGGTKDCGTTSVGKKVNLSCVVKNAGAANLVGTTVVVTGPNATEFKVTANVAAAIKPGKSKTFKVQFVPLSPGIKTAQLVIASNDPDENPYLVNLTATVTAGRDANREMAKDYGAAGSSLPVKAGSGDGSSQAFRIRTTSGKVPLLGKATTTPDDGLAPLGLDLCGTTWTMPAVTRVSATGTGDEEGQGHLTLTFHADGSLTLADDSGVTMEGSYAVDEAGNLVATVFPQGVAEYVRTALGSPSGCEVAVEGVDLSLELVHAASGPVLQADFGFDAWISWHDSDSDADVREQLSYDATAIGTRD